MLKCIQLENRSGNELECTVEVTIYSIYYLLVYHKELKSKAIPITVFCPVDPIKSSGSEQNRIFFWNTYQEKTNDLP